MSKAKKRPVIQSDSDDSDTGDLGPGTLEDCGYV